MPRYYFLLLLRSSILFPAIAGIVRFRKIDPVYYPFIFLMWAGALNEIVGTLLSFTIRNNTYSFNTFTLIEALLITWQFRKWNLFSKNINIYHSLIFLFTGGWLVYFFILGYINTFNSHFLIMQGFILVFMTVNYLNKLISKAEGSLVKDPRFIICIAFLLYFTINCTLASFWLFDFELPPELRTKVFSIIAWMNVFGNLLYTVAIVLFPAKQKFLIPELASEKKELTSV
jgi:hypothetical protein